MGVPQDLDVFVARQPIFSKSRELFAYELLFRSDTPSDAPHDAPGRHEDTSATMQVLANSLLSIGLENIVEGKKAFVNLGSGLLLHGLPTMPRPEQIVLEILESVEPTAELVARCKELRELGYTIALDDFTGGTRFDPLIDVAQILKVDMRQTSQPEQERILRAYQPRGLVMLAEKVETLEEFEWAKAAGYDLFQGFFFARPSLVHGHQIPASRFNCLQLLQELQEEELDFDRLAKMISGDLSFSYKLLRYVNSALFTHRTEISSIGQSLLILGETGVRHWIALVALPQLAKDKPGELVTHSLVRATFCERLAGLAGILESAQGFLAGLFSLLDALLDVPLEEALIQVGVVPAIRNAVLGTVQEQDKLRLVYLLATRYEKGDWPAVEALASRLRIDLQAIGRVYSESMLWAQRAVHATVRRRNTRKEPRHPVEGPLRIRWEDHESRERMCIARLLNISRSGLHLEVDETIPVRTMIFCNDPKQGIAGGGVVRYCNSAKGNYHIGVEFSNGTGWKTPELGRD